MPVDLFPARVPIGRVRVGNAEYPVYAGVELLRALRTVEKSVNAVESGFTALEVTNIPAGGIVSTNVQDALNELDTEKASVAALVAHTANTSNPHLTTAAQVGADPAGTAAGAVAAHVLNADPHAQYATDADLTAHTGDTANPHATTAVQVGADPVGTAAAAVAELFYSRRFMLMGA